MLVSRTRCSVQRRCEALPETLRRRAGTASKAAFVTVPGLRGGTALRLCRAAPGTRDLSVALVVMSLLTAPAITLAASAPQRVVSLNMCTDELLLRLAPPDRLASVTWLSRDPASSNVAAFAAGVPVNHGLAEEIIPAAPDLVLAGATTTRTAVALLKQTHFKVAEFGIPASFPEIDTQIRQVAGLLDETSRGEQLIGEIDRGLAAIPAAPPGRRPTALVYNPNGLTVGPGTLADAVMTRAGLDNLAGHLDLGNYQQLPVETVARSGVDILIVSATRDGPPSLATDILHHPVLERLSPRTRIVVLPGRLWACGGPDVVEAVARLRAAADAVRAGLSGD